MGKALLIIFVKNPILGKVKTRLAASIGDERALEAYIKLLNHTKAITSSLTIDKRVYYTWDIDENDLWSDGGYEKHLQSGEELGDRMMNAFQEAFDDGYSSVAIIGSDCYDLDTATIEEAFTALENNDVVIGPATDGGYYLLGMTQLYPQLFQNKKWSTESVFIDTIEDVIDLNILHKNLPTLSDVDNIKDLVRLNIAV